MAGRKTGGLGKGLDALIPNKVGGPANETSKKTRYVTIFLRVPKEELHRRLLQRTPDADPKEITLRLNRFDYEESKIGVYDYVLKNNNLEKTIQIITAIIENESKVKNVEF